MVLNLKLKHLIFFIISLIITSLITSLRTMALPSKRLPQNVIALISEYSKPITKPDWKYGTPLVHIFRSLDVMIVLRERFISGEGYWIYEKLYGKEYIV